MKEVTIIGVDLAKSVFQVHGAAVDGSTVFRKKLTRAQFASFMAEQPACLVAMEACGSAHYWGREMRKLGHEACLIAPIYVKPFVKRQKNDAADAEAIVEAATRPNMRFVFIKSEEQQGRGALFRTRELFVGQRTQLVNALRAHLAEFGLVVPKGIRNVKQLAEHIENPENILPESIREVGKVYLDQIEGLTQRTSELEASIKAEAKHSDISRQLQTIPGIGPITAIAVEAYAPEMGSFDRGRNFSAWLGLVPKQHSTGGKQILGRTSRMGQKDIRRLLIIGAMSVIKVAVTKGVSPNSWLGRMLVRKPRMVVAIALANKMARMIWAMLTKGEDYRDPMAETVA
jgi:transposase